MQTDDQNLKLVISVSYREEGPRQNCVVSDTLRHIGDALGEIVDGHLTAVGGKAYRQLESWVNGLAFDGQNAKHTFMKMPKRFPSDKTLHGVDNRLPDGHPNLKRLTQ